MSHAVVVTESEGWCPECVAEGRCDAGESVPMRLFYEDGCWWGVCVEGHTVDREPPPDIDPPRELCEGD